MSNDFQQLSDHTGQLLIELAEFAKMPEARVYDSEVSIEGYKTFFDDLKVFLERLQTYLDAPDVPALRAISDQRGRFSRWAAEAGFTSAPLGKRIHELVWFDLRSSLENPEL